MGSRIKRDRLNKRLALPFCLSAGLRQILLDTIIAALLASSRGIRLRESTANTAPLEPVKPKSAPVLPGCVWGGFLSLADF
jgi:hypothetical protein